MYISVRRLYTERGSKHNLSATEQWILTVMLIMCVSYFPHFRLLHFVELVTYLRLFRKKNPHFGLFLHIKKTWIESKKIINKNNWLLPQSSAVALHIYWRWCHFSFTLHYTNNSNLRCCTCTVLRHFFFWTVKVRSHFSAPLAPPLLTFWSCNNSDPASTPPCLYRGRRCCVKCHTLGEMTALTAGATFGVWPGAAERLQTALRRRVEPAKPNKPSPLSPQSSLSGALQSPIDWLMGRGRRVRLSVESSAGGSTLQSEPISRRASAPSTCMGGSIGAHAAVRMKYSF